MPSDALRRGRYSEPGRAYFVTCVVRARQPVFASLAHARALIGEMRALEEGRWVTSQAWVVMPDHVHWLFVLGSRACLSETVRRLKGRSSRRIAHANGALWQAGFHDHALRDGEAFQDVARYIVANPLRAGLVQRLGDYPHWDAVWL